MFYSPLSQPPCVSGPNRFAFTLVEIVISIVVVAIMFSLVFPALSIAKERADAMKCLRNTRAYGGAIMTYLADHGVLPAGASDAEWSSVNYRSLLVPSYLPQILRCPIGKDSMPNSMNFHYAGNRSLNRYYPKVFDVPAPLSRVVVAVEFYYWDAFHSQGQLKRTIFGTVDGSESPTSKAQYHGSKERRGLHFFFADGHIELVKAVNNDWYQEPLKGTSNNGGYFYLSEQFMMMKNGNLNVR